MFKKSHAISPWTEPKGCKINLQSFVITNLKTYKKMMEYSPLSLCINSTTAGWSLKKAKAMMIMASLRNTAYSERQPNSTPVPHTVPYNNITFLILLLTIVPSH